MLTLASSLLAHNKATHVRAHTHTHTHTHTHSQHMANILWAAAVLGTPLPPSHCASYFAATHSMLPSLNGQVRAATVVAASCYCSLVRAAAVMVCKCCSCGKFVAARCSSFGCVCCSYGCVCQVQWPASHLVAQCGYQVLFLWLRVPGVCAWLRVLFLWLRVPGVCVWLRVLFLWLCVPGVCVWLRVLFLRLSVPCVCVCSLLPGAATRRSLFLRHLCW